MKYFKVTTSVKGKLNSVVIPAPGRAQAMEIARVRRLGRISKAVEVPEPLEVKLEAIWRQLNQPKVNLDDTIPAFKQMAMMLNAGISINQTLEDLINFTDNPLLKQIFEEALQGINQGRTLTDSFNRYSKELGKLAISMIELGEQTGNLAESLSMLAKTLEEIRDNVKKFKKALRTPMITLGAMAIAFVVLIMLVVPKFKTIFEGFGAELPLPTIILLKAEYLFSNFGPVILAGLVGLFFGLKYYYNKSSDFEQKFDQGILKVYLIGKIINLSSLNQFMLTLSHLVKAGIPLESALNSSSNMASNLYLRNRFSSISSDIKHGVALTEAFKNTELFEPTVIQMINTGEQSGNLDEMLGVAGGYYKMKYDQIVDNISSYVEPIMTAFVAGLVLLLALGIFMPMWDLASAAKG